MIGSSVRRLANAYLVHRLLGGSARGRKEQAKQDSDHGASFLACGKSTPINGSSKVAAVDALDEQVRAPRSVLKGVVEIPESRSCREGHSPRSAGRGDVPANAARCGLGALLAVDRRARLGAVGGVDETGLC
jgi:hypothetical protein